MLGILLIMCLSSVKEIILIPLSSQKDLSIWTVPVEAVQIYFKFLKEAKFFLPRKIFDLLGLVNML